MAPLRNDYGLDEYNIFGPMAFIFHSALAPCDKIPLAPIPHVFVWYVIVLDNTDHQSDWPLCGPKNWYVYTLNMLSAAHSWSVSATKSVFTAQTSACVRIKVCFLQHKKSACVSIKVCFPQHKRRPGSASKSAFCSIKTDHLSQKVDLGSQLNIGLWPHQSLLSAA